MNRLGNMYDLKDAQVLVALFHWAPKAIEALEEIRSLVSGISEGCCDVQFATEATKAVERLRVLNGAIDNE